MAKSETDQARTLAHSAGARVRRELVLTRVRGDDRLDWLNGQITNDVRDVRPDQALYALAVTVRGKIMADLWVLALGDDFGVLLPQPAQARVLESFEQQIIMEDVELVPAPEARVISVQGPRAAEAMSGLGIETPAADELGHGGVFVLASAGELDARFARVLELVEGIGGCAVDDAAYELARLRAGRPRFGADFDDRHYPQQAGLKSRTVSFHKGCYLGQEVVCTLENRGRLTRELCRLESSDDALPPVGAELLDPAGSAVGELTSAVFDPELGKTLALGYVKTAHAEPGALLHAGPAAMRVVARVGEP